MESKTTTPATACHAARSRSTPSSCPPARDRLTRQWHAARRLGVRLGALGGAAVLAISCRDASISAPEAGPAVRRAQVATPTATETQTLARGLALAMNTPSIRAEVRNAMRDSRFADHKLVLQDFIASDKGTRLVDAAAAALGTTRTSLVASIENLPKLDFYVPFRANRQAWRGSGDLLVASTYDKFAESLDFFTRIPSGDVTSRPSIVKVMSLTTGRGIRRRAAGGAWDRRGRRG